MIITRIQNILMASFGSKGKKVVWMRLEVPNPSNFGISNGVQPKTGQNAKVDATTRETDARISIPESWESLEANRELFTKADSYKTPSLHKTNLNKRHSTMNDNCNGINHDIVRHLNTMKITKIINEHRIMSVAPKTKQLLTTYSAVSNNFINKFYQFGKTYE